MDRVPRNVSMSYGTSQGPAGRIRGPWDKPGSRRTNQDPVGRSRPRGTNLGPAGRIRAPGRIGPRGMSQGPAEQIRACGESGSLHYQRRTRAPLTNQGPKGRIRTPKDRVGSRRTEQGPAEQTPHNAFQCVPIVLNKLPPDQYVISRPISVEDSAKQR